MRPPRVDRKRGVPDEVREKMNAIKLAGTPEQKMRATINLANTLPVSKFAEWLDAGWFNLRDGCELTLFSKIIAERWRQEDPEGFLAWCVRSKSDEADQLLSSWSESDPQRVIDFFKEHPDDALQMQALRQIAEKNPALAIQSLKELIARKPTPDQLNSSQDLLRVLAKSDQGLVEALIPTLKGSWKNLVELSLVSEKLATSYDSTIRELWARPDGLKLFESTYRFGEASNDSIIDSLADMPASWRNSLGTNPNRFITSKSAEKWISADLEQFGFSEADAKRIRTMALSQLSYSQPEKALQMIDSIEDQPTNRAALYQQILSRFRNQPEKQASLLALIPSSEIQQQLRESFKASEQERTQLRETMLQKAPESASDWLTKAGQASPENGSSYQLMSALGEWDKDRIADLNNQFQSLQGEQKLAVAKMLATVDTSAGGISEMRGEALKMLISESPGKTSQNGSSPSLNLTAAASEHVATWVEKDPDAASRWTESLPAGEARTWAIRNLASRWGQYDPDALAKWVGRLPASDREQVQTYLKNGR